ncbi:fungal-specific transcription factor domain-containing protein [Pisolithus albus]|nr:fungal-specific transcription factor domain-containing protein [Pisolithus albus]
MSERIRQLEDALRDLQARHSTEPHPLLRPDPLETSQPGGNVTSPSVNDTLGEDQPTNLEEALGTLSISDDGAARFFGATGGSQFLLMFDNEDLADGSSDSARDSRSPEVSQEIEVFATAFPFKPPQSTLNEEILVMKYLPTWDRALYLTEAYLEQASSLFQSVSRDDVHKLLPAYYRNGKPHITQVENPHRLSLLFLIFAIAALLDSNQEPGTEDGTEEAERYHKIARAAICLRSVIEKPSLETIQALHLLSVYNSVSGNELAGGETSTETTWSLVTLAAHLAHTLGLHRDGLKWGLSAEDTGRRRMVFWDLFVADVWNCLEAGRPPTFSLPYIDCQYPGGGSPRDGTHMDFNGRAFCSTWVFRFASDCVADVAARTLTSEPPSYSTIRELDRKVCNFPVPEAAKEFATAACGPVPPKPADKDIDLTESMGRLVMSNAREVILLYIHRSYFARAIIENPDNPLDSLYAPSFLAAYQASLTILRTVKAQYDLHPKLTARLWPLWTYAFSAAVVFVMIVIRAPRSPMASSAMKELRDARLFFSEASSRSRRAQKAYFIINKLTEKALNTLHYARSDMPTENEADDELDIFTGRTKKFVSVKRQTTDGASERSSNSSGSARQSSSPDVSQRRQEQTEPLMLQSYSREQLGSAWLQQSSSAVGPEQMQEMPTWDGSLYADPSSLSALMQVHPVPVPSQAPVHCETVAGPSTRSSLLDSSDLYSMANHSDPSAQAHPQGYHSHRYRYDPQAHYPLTPSTPSDVPCYNDRLVSAGAHQNLPQARVTSTHPHTQTHSRQPFDPLHHHQHQPQHQPAHAHLHQLQPVPLVPPELAQLGLVTEEPGFDQRWTSFMRSSGFFDGYGYKS